MMKKIIKELKKRNDYIESRISKKAYFIIFFLCFGLGNSLMGLIFLLFGVDSSMLWLRTIKLVFILGFTHILFFKHFHNILKQSPKNRSKNAGFNLGKT